MSLPLARASHRLGPCGPRPLPPRPSRKPQRKHLCQAIWLSLRLGVPPWELDSLPFPPLRMLYRLPLRLRSRIRLGSPHHELRAPLGHLMLGRSTGLTLGSPLLLLQLGALQDLRARLTRRTEADRTKRRASRKEVQSSGAGDGTVAWRDRATRL